MLLLVMKYAAFRSFEGTILPVCRLQSFITTGKLFLSFLRIVRNICYLCNSSTAEARLECLFKLYEKMTVSTSHLTAKK